MRTATNNPFTPGFGDAAVWVPRTRQVAAVRAMVSRARTGARQAPRLIEQERGFGKTSLLAAVEDLASDWEDDAVVIRVTAVEGEPFMTALAHRLSQGLRQVEGTVGAALVQVSSWLGRVREIRLAGVLEVDVDETAEMPASLALGRALQELGAAARADGDRPVVLLIDEAQAIDAPSRRAVFTALQEVINTLDATGRVLPFAVVLAGLPGTRAAFKRHRVTFGERCRDLPLESLEDEAIRDTLLRFDTFNTEGVTFAGDGIEEMIEATGGHPHVFQLVGEGAWNHREDGQHITAEDVRAGVAQSQRELAMIAQARLNGLTESQLGWLRAMAGIAEGERTLTSICRAFRGRDSATASDCGSIADALLTKGVIRRADDGSGVVFALRSIEDHLRA
ncbi:ATP-binding protein [Euzebya tangerina]|uniref:ATP-binding protein n=1 Tax=Euzebya tangerina TaxID=591198 RepID=UPI000E316551|nr:ATP-binding protein [Euzebya tangerina]